MRLFSAPDAPWTVLLANIEPESTGVTVGGLIPARSYQFRLCAVNDVGRGQFSKETDRLVLRSASLHLLNVRNVVVVTSCMRRSREQHYGGAFTALEQTVLPPRLGSSIENHVIISCKSTFFFFGLRSCGREREMSQLRDGPFSR